MFLKILKVVVCTWWCVIIDIIGPHSLLPKTIIVLLLGHLIITEEVEKMEKIFAIFVVLYECMGSSQQGWDLEKLPSGNRSLQKQVRRNHKYEE